jgi:3-methyladenine DNA glycosylase AlkD
MMTLDEVMKELAGKANANCKRTFLRHGAPEPFFGVRIGDLKPIQKKLKGCQDLALELYATKNSDAMYLAGLIADGAKMTRRQLDQWAAGASWHMIAGSTVPWVAAEHPEAVAIAQKWIDSSRELTATAGWCTLSAVVATVPDDKLPLKELKALLERCEKTIHTAPNRVRYTMNSFIISCGTYVAPLADRAMAAAKKIGKVDVDMGDTDCQVPDAASYIVKSRRGAAIAPKRKTTRC